MGIFALFIEKMDFLTIEKTLKNVIASVFFLNYDYGKYGKDINIEIKQ